VAHRIVASLVVLCLLAAAAWQLRQPAAGSATKCPRPAGVVRDGRVLIACRVPASGLSLRQLFTQLGIEAGTCPSSEQMIVKPGEQVRLGQSCEPITEALPAAQRLLLGIKLEVNRATAQELQALPRIGPTLSRRIVEQRERHGRFRDLEDLQRVKGIGPRTVERLQPHVIVRP